MKPLDSALTHRTSSALPHTDAGPCQESNKRFHGPEGGCTAVSELLARIGDKWSLLVVSYLGEHSMRFNELRRGIGNISQKMLTSTLRNLERDGFVSRTVTPSRPPQVEYALTELGRDLLVPVNRLALWTVENMEQINAARAAYDEREGV